MKRLIAILCVAAASFGGHGLPAQAAVTHLVHPDQHTQADVCHGSDCGEQEAQEDCAFACLAASNGRFASPALIGSVTAATITCAVFATSTATARPSDDPPAPSLLGPPLSLSFVRTSNIRP